MSTLKGKTAPDFELFDDQNGLFRLSDHKGKNNVLLLFYPGAFTSVCTTELNTVNNDRDEYGSDTLIVGISTDSPFVLKEFRNANGLSFALLSDHNAVVSEAYGSKYKNDFTDMKLDRIAKRSAFVVNKEGLITYAEVLENAGEMPDLDQVKKALSSN